MRPIAFAPDLTTRMLSHLGIDDRPDQLDRPSPEALGILHRAFLDAVPYENLEIQFGRETGIDPAESAERIVTGRGGYCYHLNGTFGVLLHSLGYRVRFAMGNPHRDDPASWGEHALVLVEFPEEGTWIADVGIGDGFRDPLPLAPGAHGQGPFRYEIEQINDTLWRYHHDPLGTIDGFDFDIRTADPEVFRRQHATLSTSPESPFVRLLTVQARRADHVLVLRGCVLTTIDAVGKRSTDVDTERDWWDVVTGEFGLRLTDVDAETRAALWKRIRTAHEAWVDAGRT